MKERKRVVSVRVLRNGWGNMATNLDALTYFRDLHDKRIAESENKLAAGKSKKVIEQ